MKDSTMVYPTNLEDLTFEKMSDHKKKYEIQEKVGMVERTKFVSMKQEIYELIIKYLYRLPNVSGYCEFEKLGQEEQTFEEDLIQLLT